MQDDGIRGVTGKVPEAWGAAQPRQRNNQNKVTLGGVKQHEWKSSFFTHLVLIDFKRPGQGFCDED